jgi:hypothetical protein
MCNLVLLLTLTLLVIMNTAASSSNTDTAAFPKFVLKESAVGVHSKSFEWEKESETPAQDELLELNIDVQQNDAAVSQVLKEISDPKSPNYGKSLTRDEVNQLALNPVNHEIVIAWVKSFPNQSRVHYKEKDGNRIVVIAPIASWEEVLHTHFGFYSKKSNRSERIVRAENYFLDESVTDSVSRVHPVSQFPVRVYHGPVHGTTSTIRINPGLQNVAAGGTVNNNKKPPS